MADALFHRIDDHRYEATDHSTGPWSPDALHGGPPAALVAGVMEQVAAELPTPMFPARTTFELQRPVPHGPLTVEATVRRPGRKVALVDGAILDPAGNLVLAATMQCIRSTDLDPGRTTEVPTPPGPATGRGLGPETLGGPPAFVRSGVEHRFVEASFEEIGPATDWIRLRMPVVAGETPSPLQRTVAAADFGNGISRWFGIGEMLFLNPDLTVVLHREPKGEWICLEAVTHFGPHGVGMSESRLFDEHGPVGRAVQSLLVEQP